MIPWGKKDYFDRSRFDADLKRIQAFYADRGYPDARVTGFDVKLNDKQDAVDLTVTIAEGEPVRSPPIDFVGFDVIPPTHLDDLKKQRAAQGRRSRATGSSSSRRTSWRVNELTDHGYPVREGRDRRRRRPRRQAGDADVHRRARARSRTSARSRSPATRASASASSGAS